MSKKKPAATQAPPKTPQNAPNPAETAPGAAAPLPTPTDAAPAPLPAPDPAKVVEAAPAPVAVEVIKVKIMRTHPDYAYHCGEVNDLPVEKAAFLVEGGFAEYVN